MSSESPIRVLHVITRMVKGGAQENTLANVVGIHGRSWASSLVTGPAEGAEGSLEPECEAAGVRLLHVPELVREISPAQDVAALHRLTTLFRAEQPHVVHTHTSKAGILGRLAARRARVPVVIHTPHGHVFHSYEGKMKTELFVRSERFCARLADRLVALTPTELREHLELGVGRPEQWTTIHSGVNFGPFQAACGKREAVRAALGLPAEAVVVGTVGRLVPIKGQTYLIEAVSRLAFRHPGLHLLMVGDGPLQDELIAQAESLNLRVVPPGEKAGPGSAPSGTVHFLGLRRDVPQLMAALDLFVLPSLNEGMGRVLVEAMAMELPCVGTRVSGIPDVIGDGQTGLLVPARDASALAQAISGILSDPEMMREMGRRGREKVIPEFGVRRMIEKLELLYRETLVAKGVRMPS